MATSRLRIGDQEFGSVFKRPGHGGPKYIERSNQYPSWSDPRIPGNTDSNMEASKIMARWTPAQMKRFEFFMDQHKVDMTPWKREWLDKTAPGHGKQREDIIKCKLELIKRILRIKMTGPESMEDWCLYFLYYDDKLDIPQDVETLIRPNWSAVERKDWYDNTKDFIDEFPYLVADAEQNIQTPSNLSMPGLEQERFDLIVGQRRRIPTFYESRGRLSGFNNGNNNVYFPSRMRNREIYNTTRNAWGAGNLVNRERMRRVRYPEDL